MTLLHIRKDHMDKLKNNCKLKSDEDKATIYYSKPLEMSVKDERDILLETLFKLSFINSKINQSNT